MRNSLEIDRIVGIQKPIFFKRKKSTNAHQLAPEYPVANKQFIYIISMYINKISTWQLKLILAKYKIDLKITNN